MSINLECELIPPPELVVDGSSSLASYIRTGATYAGLFKELLPLRPDMAVLEMGSAVGRISRQFIPILSSQGSFTGIDIMPAQVRWCNETIAARFPGFRFIHADIFNTEYNPGGSLKASGYRFPFEDSSLDLVVLTSVFTHMLRNDVAHYLDEIARVLKPEGRCFATFFLFRPEEIGRISAEGTVPRFSFPVFREKGKPVVVCADSRDLEEAVAYERGFLNAMVAASGLKRETDLPGQWLHGPEGCRSGQDVLIFRKN